MCTPTPTPMQQVRYEGVTDFEVVLKSGVTVDGTLLPERDTAVVVHGDGAISLNAEDGSVIRNDTWPAVDIASTSGSVNVRVDAVYGGFAGIAAVAGGDVNVWANHVEGDFAILANSLGGNVTVDVASVYSGPGGAGVWADTTAGNVLILAGEVLSEGDFGKGLYASSENGSVAIEAGYIRAEGIGALGVLAESWENGNVVVDVDTVAAAGEGSVGIIAAAGAGDVAITANWVSSQGHDGLGIGAFAFNGDVFVDAEGVATDGDFARGIDIGAFGDVAVRNGSVFTTGVSADAVSVETVGDVGVQSQRLATYGNDSYGLRVLTSGNVAVDVDEITTFGERSAGLQVTTGNGDITARVGRVHTLATTGDWFAVGLSAWAGDATLIIDEEVRADSGYAVTMASLTGGAGISVAEGAHVYGQAVAIDSATATGTRIDIAGVVESGAGPVIKVSGNDWGDGAADIRVGATGVLRGRMELSRGDDNLANAGTFETSGVSVFGEGGDRFTNLGSIVLQGEGTAIRLAELERFENAGRVSLANGRTGDVFAVDGTVHGVPGGVLAIDVDIDDKTVDRIEVGGLSGTNALELELAGQGSLLGLSGIRVLTSDSAQNGSELVLADTSRNVGFIGFNLKYDGLASWTLESDLADAAYLAAAVPSGVRDLWRQGTQAVSTHLAVTDARADTDGVWFQLVGGDFEGNSHLSHARGSRELEWQGTHNGIQLGAETSFGDWRVGVTGGYGRATMDLGADGETRLDSINAGAYARYWKAGWFAGAVVRGERVDLETDWQSIGLADQGDGSAVGIELEAGHRFTMSRAWIEPLVRVSWIDVQLPEQHGQSGEIRWEDSALSTGELGLRMGVQGWRDLRPYASMSIAREFGNGDATVYDIGADTVRVSDEGGRTFGRFAGGAEWSLGRVDLYAEIEARVGDMEGVGGRLGARISF
ncbi:Autotransporter [Lysobacter dokdonensis DS-58]|uniref:Autotransporter n=1 Tax=Lysobacter dokdonensis DS-58 TaxID=1300345 RepID=A0A0A2WQW0_9GAMM|nr:Autotransporter [Lysobacter dokdonensis DS-58]